MKLYKKHFKNITFFHGLNSSSFENLYKFKEQIHFIILNDIISGEDINHIFNICVNIWEGSQTVRCITTADSYEIIFKNQTLVPDYLKTIDFFLMLLTVI